MVRKVVSPSDCDRAREGGRNATNQFTSSQENIMKDIGFWKKIIGLVTAVVGLVMTVFKPGTIIVLIPVVSLFGRWGRRTKKVGKTKYDLPRPAVGLAAHTAESSKSQVLGGSGDKGLRPPRQREATEPRYDDLAHFQELIKMIDSNSGTGFLNLDRGHSAYGTTHETGRRAVDGDTFESWESDVHVRLRGVDTPEQGEPGYYEAKAALGNLVVGHKLEIHTVATDHYGRRVAQVWRGPVNVNAAMKRYEK